MTKDIFDPVLMVDPPDEDTMARIAVSLCKGGNVRTITLKAFNEAQFREIIDSLS